MKLSPETFAIILIILPGFFGVAIYSYFSRTKPSLANNIIFAIFLCIISNFLALSFGFNSSSLTNLNINSIFSPDWFFYILVLGLISGSISILFIVLSRLNFLNRIMFRSGIQRHFSDDFAWDRTFRENNKRWVILRYDDGSALVGYAKYYSQIDEDRGLCLSDAQMWHPVPEMVSASAPKPKRKIEKFDGDVLIFNYDNVKYIEFR